jgi:hypothetical protein
MADALRTERGRALLPALGLAAVAAVLVLVATRHGPGASTDSVGYVAAARNLAAGRGFAYFSGETLTVWPPGYPALLAVGLELGLSVATAARVVNACSVAAVVLLSYVLFERHVRSRTCVMVGTAVVALSPTILRVADMIWSEALFCALLLAFVVVLESAIRAAARRPALLAGAAALVWGAALVRWVGLALVPAGVLALARSRPRPPVRRIVGFAALAVSVPSLWILRNVTTGASATGKRASTDRFDVDGARAVLRGVGRLALPDRVPDALTDAVGLVLVVLFVTGVAVLVRRPDAGAATTGWPLGTLAAVLACTAGFLLASYLFADTEWNARVLAPVSVPALVLGFVLYERLRDAGRRGVTTAVVVVVSVWFVMLAAWAVALAWDHGRAPRGYAASTWTDSTLAAATRATDPALTVYTNNPLGLAAATERYPIRSALQARECRGTALLALYGEVEPDELSLTAAAERIGTHRDGSLWRLDCDG